MFYVFTLHIGISESSVNLLGNILWYAISNQHILPSVLLVENELFSFNFVFVSRHAKMTCAAHLLSGQTFFVVPNFQFTVKRYAPHKHDQQQTQRQDKVFILYCRLLQDLQSILSFNKIVCWLHEWLTIVELS